MNYKKKYEEALVRATQRWECGDITREILEYVFPETQESGDEKIKRAIIATIHLYYGEPLEDEAKEMISWLEKQGEKKHADKIEPEFKVGDWVVSPNGVYWHIDAIRNGRYQVCSDSGEIADWPLDTYIYHRFSVQDAKDGDVLRIKNLTFIFQEITNDNACHKDAVVARCSYEDNDEAFGVSGPDCITDLELITPATKEQRDALMKAMIDAGYTFDLKKIISYEYK